MLQALSAACEDGIVTASREQGADGEAAALMRSADEKLARAEALQRKGGKNEYAEAGRLAEQVSVEAELADALTRNRLARERHCCPRGALVHPARARLLQPDEQARAILQEVAEPQVIAAEAVDLAGGQRAGIAVV